MQHQNLIPTAHTVKEAIPHITNLYKTQTFDFVGEIGLSQ